ncbi:MAG: sugar phosphate isomerase/epimerase [Verrucomicrobiae bacterium]|nr:sugar phosphate isomerase/epimerase [Verrucomicrobiae bacterium]
MKRRLVCGTCTYRQQSLERALEGIARSEFMAVEISAISGYCEHVEPERMSAGDMDRLAKLVESFGLVITSIAGHIDLLWPLMGKRSDVPQYPDLPEGVDVAHEGFLRLRNRVDMASHLGVPIVNTGIGVTSDQREIERFYREFDALLAYAEKRGVKIGLESHAGMTETAAATLALCRRLGRPNVGLNYDTANVRFYTGIDPVADLESCDEAELRQRLFHVHIKDHRGGKYNWDFPPLGEGEVNFRRLVELFDRIGYTGPCSLEIQFYGPGTTDPTAEIIDAGIVASYRFMREVGLGE